MVKRSYQYSSMIDLTKNMIVPLMIIVTRRKGILFPLRGYRKMKSREVALCHLECLPHLNSVVLAARSNARAIGRPCYSVYDIEVSSVGIKGVASSSIPHSDRIICSVIIAVP